MYFQLEGRMELKKYLSDLLSRIFWLSERPKTPAKPVVFISALLNEESKSRKSSTER